MIKELKANTTYKLVDKDGWFNNNLRNKELFKLWFNKGDEVLIQFVDEDYDGRCGEDVVIDAADELEFFEEVVTEEVQTLPTPTITPLPSIFVRGEEWLVTTEHPTQEGKVICVRVSDNCIECFDSTFIDEKLNPKSWQEQLCEEFNFEHSTVVNGFHLPKRLVDEDELVNMAKRIIELSGEGV